MSIANADAALLPTKADIRKMVIKNSSERLIAELSKCQSILKSDDISKLSRPQLVEQIVHLRFTVVRQVRF